MSDNPPAESCAEPELPPPGPAENPTPPPSAPTEPPAPTAARKRRAWPIWRSATNRYIAGVFGGVGERFEIDPFFLRIAAVAAAVVTRDEVPFLVPFAYTAWWLVVPDYGRRSLLTDIFRGRQLPQAAGAVLLAVLGGLVQVLPGLWFAGLLALAAWLLLRPADCAPGRPGPNQPRPGGEPPGPPGAVPGPVDPTSTETRTSDPQDPPPASEPETEAATGGAEPSPNTAFAVGNPSWQAGWGRARRGISQPLGEIGLAPRRRRRREPALWPLTLALLAVWAVVCVTVDRSTRPGLDPSVAVNGALLIIGGVLLLSAWRGRAGWTVLLGLSLIPAWVAFSASDIGRFPGRGSEQVTISAASADPVTVTHGYGSTDVWVSRRAVESGDPVEVDLSLTAGVATVEVPYSSPIELRVRGGFAVHQWGVAVSETETRLLRPDPWEGWGCDESTDVAASEEPPPLVETATVVIDATIGLGALDVQRTC